MLPFGTQEMIQSAQHDLSSGNECLIAQRKPVCCCSRMLQRLACRAGVPGRLVWQPPRWTLHYSPPATQCSWTASSRYRLQTSRSGQLYVLSAIAVRCTLSDLQHRVDPQWQPLTFYGASVPPFQLAGVHMPAVELLLRVSCSALTLNMSVAVGHAPSGPRLHQPLPGACLLIFVFFANHRRADLLME